MDALVEVLLKSWGPFAAVLLLLGIVIRTLFNKYTTAIEARAEDGAKIAVAMERNTQAIAALTELIKDRKP